MFLHNFQRAKKIRRTVHPSNCEWTVNSANIQHSIALIYMWLKLQRKAEKKANKRHGIVSTICVCYNATKFELIFSHPTINVTCRPQQYLLGVHNEFFCSVTNMSFVLFLSLLYLITSRKTSSFLALAQSTVFCQWQFFQSPFVCMMQRTEDKHEKILLILQELRMPHVSKDIIIIKKKIYIYRLRFLKVEGVFYAKQKIIHRRFEICMLQLGVFVTIIARLIRIQSDRDRGSVNIPEASHIICGLFLFHYSQNISAALNSQISFAYKFLRTRTTLTLFHKTHSLHISPCKSGNLAMDMNLITARDEFLGKSFGPLLLSWSDHFHSPNVCVSR